MDATGNPKLIGFGLVCTGLIGIFLLSMRQSEDVGTDRSRLADAAVQPPSLPEEEFIGSSTCTDCHRQIAALYQTHPMSRSMSTLETPCSEELDEGVAFETGSNREYRVERTSDRVWHFELCRDLRGETIYEQGVEVSYSIGSGSRGKGYLIQRDDLLFISPISWYAGNSLFLLKTETCNFL